MGKSKALLLEILFAVLCVVSLVFVLNKGALTYADSRAYFGMWPYVSAGYPFFLRVLHFIFGENYPSVAVGVQYIAVTGSIYVFVFHFLKLFKLKIYQNAILLVLLFYPIFDSNIYMVTNISTEGLCFALFLQVIHLSYRTFIKREFKFAVVLFVTVVVLITIRGQFQFLIPVFLLIELILLYVKKKLAIKYILVFLMIPLSVFTIDNVYHKIIQKQYFSTPFAWTAFVTSVLFVADDSDVKYLETENQKNVFKLVKSSFKDKGIDNRSHKYHEEPIDYNYFFYHYELPTLCNQTVQQVVLDYYLIGKERNTSNIVNAYLKLEATHKELFITLLPHVFTKWFGLAFQNFKTGIGGISVIVLYVLSLVLLFIEFVKKQNKLILWAVFLLIVLLINRVVISVSVHGLTRYFFYTHWIPVFLLSIGVNRIFNKETVAHV